MKKNSYVYVVQAYFTIDKTSRPVRVFSDIDDARKYFDRLKHHPSALFTICRLKLHNSFEDYVNDVKNSKSKFSDYADFG